MIVQFLMDALDAEGVEYLTLLLQEILLNNYTNQSFALSI